VCGTVFVFFKARCICITVSRVAQSVKWLVTERTAGVRSPTGAEDFSSNLCVQTGSGAHPASCTVGNGGSFPGGKARLRRNADHSPPFSAEIKEEQELYLLSHQAPPRRVARQLYFAYLSHEVLVVFTVVPCYHFHDHKRDAYYFFEWTNIYFSGSIQHMLVWFSTPIQL
jgi:hypothetical protein